MLSSSDSVPAQSPPKTPVQGHDRPRHRQEASKPNHAASTSTDRASIATVVGSPGAASTSPGLTASSPLIAVPRRDHHLAPVTETDAASPTKHQSPLRRGPSYTEPIELPPSSPSDWSAVYSHKELPQPVMSFTGDKKSKLSASGTQGRKSTWYMGRNRPPADAPRDEQLTPTDATPTKLRSCQVINESTASPTKQARTPSTAGSRFSFFSPMSAFKGLSTPTPVAMPQDDELINLDIQAALFPRGAPADGETFSPAAYKNLQMTATGLLQKFQTAYQQRTVSFAEVKAEREAQIDEKSEGDTRIQHLKMQLEDMAQQASETEAIMQSLMQELAQEKKLRIEEQMARERSSMQSEGSTVSEDLSAEEDQRKKTWRKSDGTAKSDLSFDTDEESIAEASLFSRSRSPTNAANVSEASPVDTLPPLPAPYHTKPAMLQPPRSIRQSQPQMTAFQKLFKGISGDGSKDANAGRGVDGCINCHGQDASVAWDTAGLLRDENRGLKQRVGELESAVEDALDVVNSVGL